LRGLASRVPGWNTLRASPELIAACGRLTLGRGTKGSEIGSKTGFESHRGCVGASVEARMGVWRPKFQTISADSRRRMATGSYGFYGLELANSVRQPAWSVHHQCAVRVGRTAQGRRVIRWPASSGWLPFCRAHVRPMAHDPTRPCRCMKNRTWYRFTFYVWRLSYRYRMLSRVRLGQRVERRAGVPGFKSDLCL